MSKIEQLIAELCPKGVEYQSLGSLCKIETGKLNANAASENGEYLSKRARKPQAFKPGDEWLPRTEGSREAALPVG